MSYAVINFKTKKALKEAVTKYNVFYQHCVSLEQDPAKCINGVEPIRCYNPGLGPDLSNYTGRVSLEGPHYPAAHTWYGMGEMVNGILVKVV